MPPECLLDTGALRTRMSAEIAPIAGIELSSDLTEEFSIAGVKTVGTMARVNLIVTDGTDEFSWMCRSGSATRGPTHSGWPD